MQQRVPPCGASTITSVFALSLVVIVSKDMLRGRCIMVVEAVGGEPNEVLALLLVLMPSLLEILVLRKPEKKGVRA
jgi:hypothetical protein